MPPNNSESSQHGPSTEAYDRAIGELREELKELRQIMMHKPAIAFGDADHHVLELGFAHL